MVLKAKVVDNSAVKQIKVVTVCIFTDYICPKLLIQDVVLHCSPKISDVRAGVNGTNISRY